MPKSIADQLLKEAAKRRKAEGRRVVIKNTEHPISIGRSKMLVSFQGCIRCGSEYSHDDWVPVEAVTILVGKRRKELWAQICAYCAER